MSIFEIGLPRRICKDKKEMLKFINANNGKKKSIYRSVYDFIVMNIEGNKPNYDTAIINKLFYDFDGEESWQEANKLHQELNKQKLRHKINMSGGGFIYLFLLIIINQIIQNLAFIMHKCIL